MAQTALGNKKERHYGIDMLRIVSMFMVCVLHSNLFGKYGEIIWREDPWGYLSWWGSQSLCVIAVNLYAMITGYVCITSKWRLGRYIPLWTQTAFYTVGIYALGSYLIYRSYVPLGGMTFLARNMLTVPLAGAYWYFNAYTGLFLLMPFLNALLQKLPRYDYVKLLLVLLILLPFMSTFDLHHFYFNGYSMTWLVALYAAGAFIRLHPFKIRKSICFAAYLAAAAGTFAPPHFPFPFPYDTFSYAAPLNIVASLAVFLIFKDMEIRQNWAKSFIRFTAPLTFGIYLVQCHPITWNLLSRIGEKLASIQGHPAWMPLAGGLSIFLGCAAVEWVRRCAFKLLHVSKPEEKLSAGLSAAAHFACNKALLVVSRKP